MRTAVLWKPAATGIRRGDGEPRHVDADLGHGGGRRRLAEAGWADGGWQTASVLGERGNGDSSIRGRATEVAPVGVRGGGAMGVQGGGRSWCGWWPQQEVGAVVGRGCWGSQWEVGVRRVSGRWRCSSSPAGGGASAGGGRAGAARSGGGFFFF